jgi:hypothetical protein
MPWCQAPLWDLGTDISSCQYVAVWNLRSCFCGAPSLTRGQVCNLQCNHSMVPVLKITKSVMHWRSRSCALQYGSRILFTYSCKWSSLEKAISLHELAKEKITTTVKEAYCRMIWWQCRIVGISLIASNEWGSGTWWPQWRGWYQKTYFSNLKQNYWCCGLCWNY